MIKFDVGGKKLYEFLKANYEVPEGVRGFNILVAMNSETTIIWDCYLAEKDETQNITESLKDSTKQTE